MDVIIKSDPEWGLQIFYLNIKCNPGYIWCSGIGESGTECSLEYYTKCKKASDKEIKEAVKWLKERYEEEVNVHQRLTDKFKKQIWGGI